MDHCNELCTKDITGTCALCEARAEADRFFRFWCGGGLFQAGIQNISKGVTRGWKRFANTGKIPRRWLWPGLQSQSLLFNLSNEEWKRQHDETSRTILQVLVAIVTFSFFCLVSLGTPDVSLLAGNATIKLPFVNTDVSFVYFLFLGPVTLIALTIYLHIFVGYHSLLSASQNGRGLPHVFNLQGHAPPLFPYTTLCRSQVSPVPSAEHHSRARTAQLRRTVLVDQRHALILAGSLYLIGV